MQKIILFILMLVPLLSTSQKFNLFVGTYTKTGSKGIYVYTFDANNESLVLRSNTDTVVNPSYLVIAPNKKFVYAVNETNGSVPGKVSSFAFDKKTGNLSFINQQLSGGDDPCYVSINKKNDWLIVANYSGGSVAALQINEDGSLKPASQIIQHIGSSVNKQRQEKAHVHSTVFSPDEKYLFTADLGTDKVMAYSFNRSKAEPLQAAIPPSVPVTDGHGPRHLVFHPNKKFAYLTEELTGTISIYNYSKGQLLPIQNIAAHPAGYTGFISSADVHISPDGKFLYASNRGDENNIAIFSINKTTGRLTTVGYQSAKGKTPRNFVIDPTGKYLLVANQDSDNIVVFKRNVVTGLLEETGKEISVPMPVCLKFMK